MTLQGRSIGELASTVASCRAYGLQALRSSSQTFAWASSSQRRGSQAPRREPVSTLLRASLRAGQQEEGGVVKAQAEQLVQLEHAITALPVARLSREDRTLTAFMGPPSQSFCPFNSCWLSPTQTMPSLLP